MSEDAWPPEADRLIDALGLRCPLPVVKLEAAMRRADRGETLAVRADDPIAAVDLPHAARQAGWEATTLPAPPGRCAYLVKRPS